MKKTILLMTATLFGVMSCGNEGSDQSAISYAYGLNVLAPTGAPAIALFNLANDKTFTTTTNPKEGLIPMFATDKYDIIVAPTNGGLMQIVKQNASYKIAATLTFGNFYIYSCGTDLDATINSGDKIIIFQENDIPGKVFNYCYGNLGLEVRSVNSADDTKMIISDNGMFDNVQYDYVFTAEPVLTSLNKYPFVNVQDVFEEKSGGKTLTQASVFVKNGANPTQVNAFLSTLETSINLGLANPSYVSDRISSLGSELEQKNLFGFTASIAKRTIENNNSLSIGYKKAIDIKDEIQNFINLTNPIIGELSEEVFYK